MEKAIFTSTEQRLINQYKQYGHSHDWEVTQIVGEWGERYVSGYYKSQGYNILEWSNESKWDFKAQKNETITVEVKTELTPYKYGAGGYFLELGNTLEGKYKGETDIFTFKGTPYAKTGLKKTTAKYFALTDLNEIYIFETKTLVDFYMKNKDKVKSQQGNGRVIGLQITYDEIEKLPYQCYKCKTEYSLLEILNSI
jgi:hypothetical protein